MSQINSTDKYGVKEVHPSLTCKMNSLDQKTLNGQNQTLKIKQSLKGEKH